MPSNLIDFCSGQVPSEIQNGVCIIEDGFLSVFTEDGRDYVAALPFQVESTWAIQNGLLFERKGKDNPSDRIATPKRG